MIRYDLQNILSLIVEGSRVFGEKKYLISPINNNDYLTYKDLQICLSGLDRIFKKNNIGQQESVGVILPNCVSMAALFSMIPALNRIFVPINIKSSKSEIEYIINNADVKFLFIKTGFDYISLSRIPSIKIDVENDNWIKNNFQTKNKLDHYYEYNGKNIAEIVYTSGSTGKPKGVRLSHKNLISNSFSIAKSFSFTKSDKFLTVTPLFHNSGQIFTTLSPIWSGASSVPVRPEIGLISFWNLVKENSITWTLGMGSHIYSLLMNNNDVQSHRLKGIIVGGMKLNNKKREQFEKKFKTNIYITYGLTETTSFATSQVPNTPIVKDSVGKPLAVNEIKIKKDQSDSDEGEILIKGDNIFESYQSDKEITKKKIIDGWLHSGDIGYLDNNGQLFITDRKDNLIIVSGENVYPSEIEQYTHLLPDIYEAIVVGTPHDIKGTELNMIYSLNKSCTTNIKIWKKVLISKLPIYKIPTRYIDINELGFNEIPKLPNGKILRHKVIQVIKDRHYD